MRLVIFDMDGTLIDTSTLMVECTETACRLSGIAPPEPEIIRSISGLVLETGLQRILPEADEEMVAVVAARYRETYLARAGRDMREPLFPGIAAALATLEGRDDALMAVATGKALNSAERVLAAHGIRSYFTSVQTPDTNRSKPDPEMIVSAMAAVGAEASDTVMVGDTSHDMEMAIAAGVKALAVDWGYHSRATLKAAGADLIVADTGEVVNAVDRLLGLEDA